MILIFYFKEWKVSKLLNQKLFFPLLTFVALLNIDVWGDIFFLFGLPAIGAYVFFNYQKKKDFFIQIILLLSVSFPVSINSGIMVLFWLIPFSLILSQTLKKRFSHMKVFLWTFVIMNIAVFFRIEFLQYLYEVDFLGDFLKIFEQIEFEISQNLLLQMSNIDLDAQKNLIIKYAKMTMPTWYIVVLSIIITVNDFIATFLLSIAKKNVLKFNIFSLYGMTGELNIALGVTLILSYLGSYVFEFDNEFLLYNVMLLITVVFFLYGLAFVMFFSNVLRLKRIYRVILLITGFVTLPAVSPFPYIMIGMIDTIFGIRKKISKKIYNIRK